MNIYDFDNTIYEGDSSTDFCLYCIRKYPKTLLNLPRMLWAWALYILGIYSKTKMKENIYKYFRFIDDIDAAVSNFWDKNEVKIKDFYKEQHRESDIIISASPEFFLRPICERLGIKNLIASRVDKRTGKYDGINCHGEEKVKRLYSEFPNAVCAEFYSDSLSDAPLAEIADKAVIVRGNELMNWDEYKPSKLKMFFTREFLSFVAIGVINTLSNVVFSMVYLKLLELIFAGHTGEWYTNTAFYPGYVTSNVLAYLLNSKITFNERLSFVRYVKFFVSYIPNFIIQKIIVSIFTRFIPLPSIIAYAVAAIIGVPVTFVLMKIFTFKKKGNSCF